MNNQEQELFHRIRKLFGNGTPGPLMDDERGESPIHVENLEPFEHNLNMPQGEQSMHGEPADRWLDTPNTSFGGRCPRSFLDGTEEERDLLLRIIESVADGAF